METSIKDVAGLYFLAYCTVSLVVMLLTYSVSANVRIIRGEMSKMIAESSEKRKDKKRRKM